MDIKTQLQISSALSSSAFHAVSSKLPLVSDDVLDRSIPNCCQKISRRHPGNSRRAVRIYWDMPWRPITSDWTPWATRKLPFPYRIGPTKLFQRKGNMLLDGTSGTEMRWAMINMEDSASTKDTTSHLVKIGDTNLMTAATLQWQTPIRWRSLDMDA